MNLKDKLVATFKKMWLRKRTKYPFLFLMFLLFFFLCLEFNFLWLFGSVPTVKDLKNPKLATASEMYSQDGELIGRFFRENRTSVEMREVNPYFYKGLIATEDVRFYEHDGVDWQSNAAIIWYLIKGDKRGGSTITQQLAKNLFKMRKDTKKGLLSYIPGVDMVIIKIKEWSVAYKLENNYTKEEILLLYMNTVDFGSNSFGIKTASETFFNKKPHQLDIDECAVLIGLLKATTYYSPVLHPNHAKSRRDVVLSLMKKNKVISEQQYKEAIEKPLQLRYQLANQNQTTIPYFKSAVAHELSAWCQENGYDLYADGLKIYTTIDSRLQKHAEAAVNKHMQRLQEKFDNHWKGENPWIDSQKKEIPNFLNTVVKQTEVYNRLKSRFAGNTDSIDKYLNIPHKMRVFSWSGQIDTVFTTMDSLAYYKKILHAGFVTMDPQNGFIKTWVGGIDYESFKYDHIYQSKRQPGSTFKPFVYATALSQGMSPCDKIVDELTTHHYEENGEKKSWTPKNANREYTGDTVRLRYALARSINTVAAKLTMQVTPDSVAQMAKKCGIKSELKPVPSIGLGSNDVYLLELTNSYLPFVNGGLNYKPTMVTRIVDKDGIEIANFVEEPKRVLTEENAWLMSYMLRGTTEEYKGTSQALFLYDGLFGNNHIGGKTGTSNNHSDGWYVGVTKNLVGGVWVGAEERSVHFRTGELGEAMRTALPIFGLFLESAYADPDGLKRSPFDKEPGNIDRPHDCRTKVYITDTLKIESDSLVTDSSFVQLSDSNQVD